MTSPTQPTFPSFTITAPTGTPTDPNATLQAINNAGHHSPGAITGISICVLICLAWILRYSYLASPFWLGHLRRWFGIRPSSRTPISHFPLAPSRDGPDTDTDNENPTTPYIARPEPAYIRTASKDTLPLYEPANRFSNDVLEALLDLGPVAGAARPPSYRSKLSQEWRNAMGTRARNRHDDGAADADEESGRSVSERSG
ncbi:hypothetical protein AYL99_11117 [Fonsecaea erecta]|uniref:Uncharacterized protein n=1 Tax=Fonsecaea erecta TaxID=1367422 RepID=A0A178Z4J7_9EURO|nr:hypothetical protein AYL99_11117 [Fonsecaea erecta]OAP54669.1 hypothetical protein AYL99_11117 [Fonsecaea erecta]